MTPKIQLAELEIEPILTSLNISRVKTEDIPDLIQDAINDPDPSSTFMRMFYILQTLGQGELALDMQGKALALRSLYRIVEPSRSEIRLLALMGPGDMMDNTPLEFIIENSGIRLDLLFLSLDQPLPEIIPDHDVAIVALSESDKNRRLLAHMEELYAIWPRPILNQPAHVMRCARDTASQLLSGIPGLHISSTQRIRGRELDEVPFPLTIRPVGSHAGQGFAKLDSAAELPPYFEAYPAPGYYISAYVDYRSADGLFRKYRIALIDGQPFLCHLAISDHWMVHYLSANMASSKEKCNEEAMAMENFGTGFALHHGRALSAISERLGLEYLVLDCAEMPDGSLLLFEADIAGLIHATDCDQAFGYKAKAMQKAFAAFKNMLTKRLMISSRLMNSHWGVSNR